MVDGFVVQEEGETELASLAGDQLREIHHQVKNNLQIVSSLLRIQSRALVDPEARSIFKRGEERIQSMALVYDTLYRSGLPSEVPIHQYLSDMVRQLVQGASTQLGSPHVSCELDQLYGSSRGATHLGLLVNEIISHRIRQVSQEGKPVSLLFRLLQRDGTIELNVYDDGPERELSLAISTAEQQILDALIRQLEGVVLYSAQNHFQMRVTIPERVIGRK